MFKLLSVVLCLIKCGSVLLCSTRRCVCLWYCQPSPTSVSRKLVLSSCDRCQLKASHASASQGTKCVIIVVAVAHSLCPHSLAMSLSFLCFTECKVKCEWHWKGVCFPLLFFKNKVVVSQWLRALSDLFVTLDVLFFSVEQITLFDKRWGVI